MWAVTASASILYIVEVLMVTKYNQVVYAIVMWKFIRRLSVMGQKASCAAKSSQVCPDGVLVVHIRGQADEFPTSVKVKEVLKHQSGSHFVCRWKDLAALIPLTAEEELRKGEIYMVLPMSLLHSDVSPRNLAALGNKLLAAARKKMSKHRSTRIRADDVIMGSRCSSYKMYEKLMGSCENRELQMAYREHLQLLEKTRSWKPRLYTIQESCLAR